LKLSASKTQPSQSRGTLCGSLKDDTLTIKTKKYEK
jgi:hypothetical protein